MRTRTGKDYSNLIVTGISPRVPRELSPPIAVHVRAETYGGTILELDTIATAASRDAVCIEQHDPAWGGPWYAWIPKTHAAPVRRTPPAAAPTPPATPPRASTA